MPIHRRVLITGAAGALGTQLRRHGPVLADRITLSDRTACVNIEPHEDDRPADLADFEAVRHAVEGAEAILHFGGQSIEGPWSAVRDANLVGTYNLYEAARQCRVKRVVFASSIHTVGFHLREHTIDASAPTRPDSLYGVSKTFGENLSRYYFDKFGIESVCVRIGSCFPKPVDRRHLVTWLSFGDLRRFAESALAAERVGHMIAMPTSNNSASFWDDKAASVLGFKPVDSADDYREEVLAKTPQGDPHDVATRFQGGTFCSAGHFDDPR